MADQILTSDHTSIVNFSDGDYFFLARDASLQDDAHCIFGTGTHFAEIYGNVSSTGLYTNGYFNQGGDSTVVIGTEASITSTDQAVRIIGTNYANVYNHGDLTGYFGCVTLLGGSGTQNFLLNTGTISGFYAGVATRADGGLTIVTNAGVISSQYDAIYHTEGDYVLYNSGTISGVNSSFIGGDAQENIHNTGVMYGYIEFRSGDDFYDGNADGRVVGNVLGGDGNDSLGGGRFFDSFAGENGDDWLSGRQGRDSLSGGDGSDTLRGGDGNDTLAGGTEDDKLVGGAGHDDISADAGHDHIRAGQGDDTVAGAQGQDTLLGGRGDDTLDGGSDADLLKGGRGNDELTGGGGADMFIFARNHGDDTITDFEDGIDLIDISAFGLDRSDFRAVVKPVLSALGNDQTIIDFSEFGGNGSVTVEGLGIGDIGAADFIL